MGEGRLRGRDLARPFHGLRSSKPTLGLADRCASIAPTLPPGSFFNSATAAALLNAPLPFRLANESSIHVAVVSPHRALEGRGVTGHKVQLMGGDSWMLRGLPVSTPERAWCELGVLLSIPELVAVGDWLVNVTAPLTTLDKLGDALRRYPDRRGKRKLLAAGNLLDGRAESPKESELRAILVQGGVRGLESNWPVRIANRNYRIDLAIPSRRLAIEYQGDYHRDQEQWRRDMTRISWLESEQWYVFQFNADDLRDDRELVERVQKVLDRRPFFP